MSPYAKEIESYAEAQPADAQFSRTLRDDRPAIRAILPTLGWEFSDGTYIGRDPEGLFCYNRLSHFPKNTSSKYEVATRTSDEGDVWVNVKFYAANGRDVFGEFFAHDKQNAAEKSKMVGAVGQGRWLEVDTSESPAHARKLKGESTVTITVANVWWKVQFDVDEELKQHEVAVEGHLRYKDLDDISDGIRVRWNFDHFIFYKDEIYSKDYTAYFMFRGDTDVATTELVVKPKTFGAKWTKWTKEERAAAKRSGASK